MEILPDSEDFCHDKQQRTLDQVVLLDNNFYNASRNESAFKLEYVNSTSKRHKVIEKDCNGDNNRLISFGLRANSDSCMKVTDYDADSWLKESALFRPNSSEEISGVDRGQTTNDLTFQSGNGLPSLNSLPCFKLVNNFNALSSPICAKPLISHSQFLLTTAASLSSSKGASSHLSFTQLRSDANQRRKIVLRIIKRDPANRDRLSIGFNLPSNNSRITQEKSEKMYSDCFSMTSDQSRSVCGKNVSRPMLNNIKREQDEEFCCDESTSACMSNDGNSDFGFSEVVNVEGSSNVGLMCRGRYVGDGNFRPSCSASPLPLIDTTINDFGVNAAVNDAHTATPPTSAFVSPSHCFIMNNSSLPPLSLDFDAIGSSSCSATSAIQPVASMLRADASQSLAFKPSITTAFRYLDGGSDRHPVATQSAALSVAQAHSNGVDDEATFDGVKIAASDDGIGRAAASSVISMLQQPANNGAIVGYGYNRSVGGFDARVVSQSSTLMHYTHVNGSVVTVDRVKLERKRERNRAAATKCRRRKLERIAALQSRVDQLWIANDRLRVALEQRDDDVRSLRRSVAQHRAGGCVL